MKLYRCSKCRGEFPASAFYVDRTRPNRPVQRFCKDCKSKMDSARFKNNKLRAVKYKGGRCELCGYNKCTAALEFHHKDPTKKDPNFTHLKSWGWKRTKIEINNCQLLCANCHREVEYKE